MGLFDSTSSSVDKSVSTGAGAIGGEIRALTGRGTFAESGSTVVGKKGVNLAAGANFAAKGDIFSGLFPGLKKIGKNAVVNINDGSNNTLGESSGPLIFGGGLAPVLVGGGGSSDLARSDGGSSFNWPLWLIIGAAAFAIWKFFLKK